jgi:hypothetical protein
LKLSPSALRQPCLLHAVQAMLSDMCEQLDGPISVAHSWRRDWVRAFSSCSPPHWTVEDVRLSCSTLRANMSGIIPAFRRYPPALHLKLLTIDADRVVPTLVATDAVELFVEAYGSTRSIGYPRALPSPLPSISGSGPTGSPAQGEPGGKRVAMSVRARVALSSSIAERWQRGSWASEALARHVGASPPPALSLLALSASLDRIRSSSISLKRVSPAEPGREGKGDPGPSRKAGKLGKERHCGSAPRNLPHRLRPSAARSSSAASVQLSLGLPAASHSRLAALPSAAFPAFLQSREQ